MSPEQIEELWCLQQSNDATGKPSAIALVHWDGGIRYDQICEAGYAKRYAKPPKGFGPSRFFGVKITPLGRSFIERERRV